MTSGRQRLQGPRESEFTDEQKAVHDAIVSGPRGMIGGPLPLWLHSPRFASLAQQVGEFCRFGSSLERRLSELAIIVTGAFWRADFEWHFHAPLAIDAGIAPEAVEAIRVHSVPSLNRADERAVYRFCRELLADRRISQQTYDEAVALLGEVGVVDLVAVLGYYGLVSLTLVAFQVELPEGADPPFEDYSAQ